MQKQPKKSSPLPVILIGLVLVAAVAGGYYLYSSSKPDAANANASRTAANASRTTPAPVNAPAGAPLSHNMLGSPTAAVTVEEFADFQCGSCAAAHPKMKEIQSIYGPRIKFVFRHFPLAIPAHDKAYEAAIAAEAAGMQGKFWQMQDQLMLNQSAWSQAPNYKQLWADYAQKIGLDVAKFQADASGPAAKQRVDQDLSRGRGLSVNSTPSVFVNGRSIPYPQLEVATLRQIIDAELQRAASTQSSNTNAPTAAASPAAPVSNGQ